MQTSQPSSANTRIESLDVLRGVAICGILLMNIWSMGGARTYPVTRFPPRWDAEWISWGIQSLLVQGAMRGLFTLLFGGSMLLMLRRAERNEAAPIDAWARRSLGLMGLGVAQFALFLWPGEILWNYGVSGLFLLAFRTVRVRTLLIAAAVLMAGLSANAAYWTVEQATELQAGAAHLSTEAIAAEQAEREQIRPSRADQEREIDRRTHPRSLLRWSAGYWGGQNLSAAAWGDIAESVTFMLIGMALFRLGVLTGDAGQGTYRRLIWAGYGGGLLLRGAALWLEIRTGLDMGSPRATPWEWALSQAIFEPARLLVTLGHLGLVTSAWRAGWLGRATTLRALGRMALTVYCLQSIIGSTLFYGLGLLGRFDLPALWGMAVAIWFVTAAFCRAWFARFDMGPAEQLLRAVAYGRWPELDRVKRAVT